MHFPNQAPSHLFRLHSLGKQPQAMVGAITLSYNEITGASLPCLAQVNS